MDDIIDGPTPNSASRQPAEAKGETMEKAHPRWRLSRMAWIRLGAVLVVYCVCGNTITQIPVWDELVSVFPAAIDINKEGLHFLERFRKSPADGGAPAHTLTIVTAVTALVYAVTGGGESTFILLHVFQMTLAGLALAESYRFMRPVLGVATSVLMCVAILLYPLFQSQARVMYLELSELWLTLLAVNAWVEERRGWSRAWTFLATCAKPTGIITAGSLALLELLSPGNWKLRGTRVLGMILPAIGVLALQAALAYPVESMLRQASPFRNFATRLFERLSYIWDLSALLVLFLATAIYHLPKAWGWIKRLSEPAGEIGSRADRDRRRLVSYCIGIAFICFYLLGPFTGIEPVLARYFLHVLPFLGFAVVDCFGRLLPPLIIRIGLCGLCVFFVVNRNGDYYAPQDRNDFSIAERSCEYRDLLAAQKEGVAYLQKLPADAPVVYGLFNHHMAQFPEFGYVTAPIKNGHTPMLEKAWWRVQPQDFPPELYLLMDYQFLGGQALQRLLYLAVNNPDHFIVKPVHTARHGRYRTVVFRITRIP